MHTLTLGREILTSSIFGKSEVKQVTNGSFHRVDSYGKNYWAPEKFTLIDLEWLSQDSNAVTFTADCSRRG